MEIKLLKTSKDLLLNSIRINLTARDEFTGHFVLNESTSNFLLTRVLLRSEYKTNH